MSTKTHINIKNKFDRVVVLVDMDCFYCQVEEKLNPTIKGKPIAVVQYNPWQGGGIIAVNYPAREKGVTRHMRGDEAKQHCPEIELPQVPQVRGKADLTRYREAGKDVAEVLKSFTPLLERASIDEAYLDITERVLTRIREMNEGKFKLLPDKLTNTFVVGYENIGEFVKKLSSTYESNSSDQNSPDKLEYKKSDIKLLVGASIVNEIRAAVKERTGYECSAGIAHNKILAKLTAGFHKPNKQTILPIDSIQKLYETLPLKKVKGLGGKLGDQVCEVLKIKFMSELVQFPESLLQQHFEERMGSWMYLMARGIDLEAVTAKFHSKSIGCCKRFPGKNAITGLATLNHWLNELATEVTERLEKDLDENNRMAKLLTVSYTQQIDNTDVSSTRSIPLASYEIERIAVDALEAIKRNTDRFLKANSDTALNNAIKFLGLSAGKFETNGAGKGGGIKEMFQSYSNKTTNTEEESGTDAEPRNGPSETIVSSTDDQASTSREPNISSVTTTKPRKDIKHFLQNQTKSTLNDGKEGPNSSAVVDKNTQGGNDTEENGIKNVPEPVKPRKDIKHFLQQQAATARNSDDKKAQCTTDTPEESIENLHSRSDVTNDDMMNVPQELAKPKKDITHFLKQSTCNTQPAFDVKATTVEKHLPLEEENSVSCANEQKECSSELESNASSTAVIASDMQPTTLSDAEKQASEARAEKLDESYRETYAEYCFLPPPSTITVTCPQCGKSIPENEYVSHQDFHYALSLSQQQRDEFRNDLKLKQTPGSVKSPVSAKRAAVKSTPSSSTTLFSSSSTPGVSIERFLSKAKSVDPNDTNSGSTSETEKCAECGKLIPLQEIPEHNDYHVAKRLQQELHRLEPPTQPALAASTNTKRKRPSTAAEEVLLNAKQKVKPVSSYFSKL